MRIRTIAYLGHKDTLLLSTIKKHGSNQPLNQQISVLVSSGLGGGIPPHPSSVFRTRTVPGHHPALSHTGTNRKPRAALMSHHR